MHSNETQILLFEGFEAMPNNELRAKVKTAKEFFILVIIQNILYMQQCLEYHILVTLFTSIWNIYNIVYLLFPAFHLC